MVGCEVCVCCADQRGQDDRHTLLEELRSDPRVYAAITRQMPELENITSTVEED